jgi:putative SOS response-associated peptidase YedK
MSTIAAVAAKVATIEDPRDLMRVFPPELMRMWAISRRVNKPENVDPSILEPIELAAMDDCEAPSAAAS